MSALTILIQLLIAWLTFLLSLPGVFAFLVGTVLFLGMPFVPRLTGRFKTFANVHVWLAMWAVKRAAIVVTEHDEILFKRMSFDDLGVETISFDSDTKEFEDPAVALHYFKGIPFALADEVHGILFDPRHAAVGTRKYRHEENGEMVYRATAKERSMYQVYGWIRGVFQFPEDRHELVNLSHIRQLVTGTERAEHSERVEQFYENSRDPYRSAPSVSRLAMIIFAICAPFGLMWFIASQGNSAGGGSTIGYGLLPFVSAFSLETLRRESKSVAVALAVVLPLPVVFLLLAVFVSPLLALLAAITVALGFFCLPFMTLFAREVGPFGGALSRYLYLPLGLAGYTQPVLEWTPQKYQLREYSELEDPTDVHWYGLANSLLGFTFTPGSDSWENGTIGKEEIEDRLEVSTDASGAIVQSDGGLSTNLPVEYERYPEQQRAVYAGFVPGERHLDDGSYYLDTGIWFERFTNAAVGERALRKLLRAKEEYGGDQSMDDSTLMKVVVGSAVFSFAAGLVVFFL